MRAALRYGEKCFAVLYSSTRVLGRAVHSPATAALCALRAPPPCRACPTAAAVLSVGGGQDARAYAGADAGGALSRQTPRLSDGHTRLFSEKLSLAIARTELGQEPPTALIACA